MTKRKSQAGSMAYYFFIYMAYGVVCPLVSQYLRSLGFTGTQVGIVVAGGTLGAAVGNIILGRIYANIKQKKAFIIGIILLSGVLALVAPGIRKFLPFATLYTMYYFFQEPAHSLSDSIMVEMPDKNFPLIRSFGAIGFAVASYFGGIIAEDLGLKVIFYVAAISYVVSGALMLFEKPPVNYSQEKRTAKLGELFANKKFVKLLICSFCVLGTVMGNNTYYGYLYTEAGGDIAGIGLAFFLMCIAEAVVMAILPKVKKNLSTEVLIPIGIFVAVVRFGIYSLGPSTGVLLGTFFLQGIMDGIILVEIVNYFSSVVEPRLASLAVTTYYAIGNNFSAICCNFISGVILDAFNAKAVFVFFTAINLVGLILYFVLGLHKKER